VKLPDIMKAKKKPLDVLSVQDLGVQPATPIKEVAFEAPAERQRGEIVADVAGLVAALKDKGLL